jgi:O-acetylhomoserine (thiol)-lyase
MLLRITPEKSPVAHHEVAPRLGSLKAGEARFTGADQRAPYARGGHPVFETLEAGYAAMEGGTAAVAVSSGQAAQAITFQVLLRAGDEIIASSHIFGGTLGLLNDLAHYGITVRFADPTRPESFARQVTAKTRAFFTESISNPDMLVADLRGLGDAANAAGVPLIVDNTLGATLCRPFLHGAHIVTMSTTKYLNGTNDRMGGLIVDGGNFSFRDNEKYPYISVAPQGGRSFAEIFPRAAFAAAARKKAVLYGPTPSIADSEALTERMKTAPERVQEQTKNAALIASFVGAQAEVTHLRYPGMGVDAANAARARRYFPNGAGAVMTFDLKGGREAVEYFMDNINVIVHRANVGQEETIATWPFGTTHKQFTADQKAAAGITEGTIRLSVGLENPAAVIADLRRALAFPRAGLGTA